MSKMKTVLWVPRATTSFTFSAAEMARSVKYALQTQGCVWAPEPMRKTRLRTVLTGKTGSGDRYFRSLPASYSSLLSEGPAYAAALKQKADGAWEMTLCLRTQDTRAAAHTGHKRRTLSSTLFVQLELSPQNVCVLHWLQLFGSAQWNKSPCNVTSMFRHWSTWETVGQSQPKWATGSASRHFCTVQYVVHMQVWPAVLRAARTAVLFPSEDLIKDCMWWL